MSHITLSQVSHWQTFSEEGQIVSILGFESHAVRVTLNFVV